MRILWLNLSNKQSKDIYVFLGTGMIKSRFKPFIYICIPLGLSVLFLGCDLTYKVRNQHNDIEETLHVPCGKLTLELIGKGNSKFVFSQKFNLDNEMLVFLDSINVYYNDDEIPINHNLKNGKLKSQGFAVNGKKAIESTFKLDKGVFEGDTIRIIGPNYIQCNDHLISLDTMIYTFINNLRIFGVNDF